MMWRTRLASRSTQFVVRAPLSFFNPQSAIRNSSIPIHLNCSTHFGHCFLSFRLSAARAFLDYRDNLIGILTKLAAALGDCAIALEDRIRKRAFPIHAANTRVAAIVVELISVARSQKESMHLTHIATLRMPGISPLDASAIGDHHPSFFAHHVWRIDQVDRVAVALGHLAPVGAGEDRDLGVKFLWLGEHVAEKIVEAPNDLASELDVRGLILADGNEVGFVHDD